MNKCNHEWIDDDASAVCKLCFVWVNTEILEEMQKELNDLKIKIGNCSGIGCAFKCDAEPLDDRKG